jgi:hypothetical protein
MYDRRERAKGFNPDDPENRNTIAGSGYIMLEEYINSLVSR